MGIISENGVKVHDITFSYEKKRVLEHISFSILPGTTGALIGPNGSGKTTLLKIMAGLLSPETGFVSFNGEESASGKRSTPAKAVGFVPQGQRTAFPFSCFDVVLTGRHPFVPVYQTPSKEDEAIVLQVMEDVGAGFLKDRQFTRISGGERQLILISRALASCPRFLILDEPTSFLDMKNQVQILSLIQRLTRERGITALMSIHDPNQAALYAEQVLVLAKQENGASRLIADGPSEQIFNQNILEEAFDIPIRIISSNGDIAIIPGERR